MTRNLKALGLALVAVFALSGLSASVAAAQDKATLGAATAVVTGTSHDNKFTVTNPLANVECTTSKFAGLVADDSSELTIEPTYNGTIGVGPNHTTHCNTNVGATKGTAIVDMNGCDYVLTGTTTKEDPPVSGKDAVVWVKCPAGVNHIRVTTNLGCDFLIPPQTPTTGGVRYTNEAGGKVKVDVTVTGITYTTTGFTCPFSGLPSEANNADYTGSVVVSGTEHKSGLNHPFTDAGSVSVEVSS